ncbi:MAG: hypothetical protein ACK6CU_06110 [Deltaproteobacteria bacterium]
MLFLRKAALRPVPRWAVIDEDVVTAVEAQLEDDGDALQRTLDSAYREMDRKQPDLAQWLAQQVSDRNDDLAQSLGYFLVVTVYLAFREAFPTRLGAIDETQLTLAIETFDADEALRREDPSEVMETDDVVAMTQHALVHFFKHQIEEAIEQAGESPDLEAFDHVYRTVLVEVVALSHAVVPPEGLVTSGPALA